MSPSSDCFIMLTLKSFVSNISTYPIYLNFAGMRTFGISCAAIKAPLYILPKIVAIFSTSALPLPLPSTCERMRYRAKGRQHSESIVVYAMYVATMVSIPFVDATKMSSMLAVLHASTLFSASFGASGFS